MVLFSDLIFIWVVRWRKAHVIDLLQFRLVARPFLSNTDVASQNEPRRIALKFNSLTVKRWKACSFSENV